MFIYPKSLLESWAKLGLHGKNTCRPVMEARTSNGSEFDSGDDDFDDDLGEREVDANFGNIGGAVDYSDDNEMGYSETGVNPDLDNQYSRFGMNVDEFDPTTGKLKSETTAKKSKKKGETAAGTKGLRDALTARRMGDARKLFSEIDAIASRYCSLFDTLPDDDKSEDMRTAENDINTWLNRARDISDTDSYLFAVQGTIRSMERLGIASRKNNTIPDGIPENSISAEQLASLVYLFETERQMMNDLKDGELDDNVLSPRRLATRALTINRNIAGLGNDDEPLMPEVGERLYKSSFAPWEQRSLTAKEAFRKSAARQTMAHGDGQLDNFALSTKGTTAKVEYLGPENSNSANAAVPHQFFTSVCERIENDKSIMHKGARKSLIQEFNNSIELTAAYLLVYGARELKNQYGVAPPRIREISESPCYLQFSSKDGSFSASNMCLKLTIEMFGKYKDEIAGKRAKFVDAAGTVYESFPTYDSQNVSSSGHVSQRTIPAVDFLDTIISTLEYAMHDTGSATRLFVSKELFYIISKGLLLKRNARKIRENGKWVMTSGEPIPLFDYFAINHSGATAMRLDARLDQHNGAGEGNSTTLHERISQDDVLETSDGLRADQTSSEYIKTFLEHPTLPDICELFNISPASIPIPASPEKEKINFLISIMLKLSDIMMDLGASSYIVRRPGNELDEVISDEDKVQYGRECTVAEVWKNTWRKYNRGETSKGGTDEDGDMSPNTVKFLNGKVYAKRVLMSFAPFIIRWLESFQTYEYDRDDMITALTGVTEEYEKAKDLLTPYIEMVPLIVSIASSGMLNGKGGRGTNGFKLAMSYINKLQKDINIDLFSPNFLDTVIKYIKRNYNGMDDMLEYATEEAPYDSGSMLEWCVVRFLMSGIDSNSKLVPPDQVGQDNPGADTAAPKEASIPPILKKYREILAAKPSYLKRDAWLRKHNIMPETYDYLEQQASGKADDTRVIDMSVGEISGWITDDYLAHGDDGEIVLLMLGLIYVGTKIYDADMQATSKFKEDRVNERIHESSMQSRLRLPDAMNTYGADFLGQIIGDLVGDGGTSLAALLNIIGSHEPLTVDELEQFLEPVTGDEEAGEDAGSDASAPKSESELADELYQMVGKLSSTSFLVFNGIA